MLALVAMLAFMATEPHEPAPRAAITWEEAFRRALEAPGIAAVRAAVQERRELDGKISGLGNPEVELVAGVRKGEVDQGFDGEVTVIQPFPLAPVGAGRRNAARAETRLLDARARALRLERGLQVASAFCRLHAAERAREEAENAVSLAEEILVAVERGQRAGVFTSQDVALARLHVAEARLDLLAAEGEAFELGVELGRAVLHDGPYPLVTSGPLPLVALPPEQEWTRKLSAEKLPSSILPILEAEAARARLREREVEARAFWVGIGATALRESQERALLGTLRFTIPLFDRGLRDRGQLSTEARLQEGTSAEERKAAAGHVASIVHEVEHSEATYEHLRDTVVALAEENLRLARLAFEAGEQTVLDVLRAQSQLVSLRMQLHRAEADRALARLRLALLLEAVDGPRTD